MTTNDDSSGGYISVDRLKALKDNWELIKRIQRPCNIKLPDPTPDTATPSSNK